MHLTITGGTGFLGSKLVEKLLAEGHAVSVVSRSEASVRKRWGDAVQAVVRDAVSPFPAEALKGTECVVHLMGESLAAVRWSRHKKEQILNSRIQTTKLLVAALPESCHTFVCGSAIGIYPSGATQPYTEGTTLSEPTTFLERVCQERENQAKKAVTASRRVVHIRTSLVLGSKGILPLITKATKRGGGVVLGNGKRHFSWVHETDRVGAVHHSIVTPSIRGPVNVAAPQVVTFSDFTRQIARIVHRPVRLKIPERILRLVQGEASQLILADQYVVPSVLQKTGYIFCYVTLQEALREIFQSTQ